MKFISNKIYLFHLIIISFNLFIHKITIKNLNIYFCSIKKIFKTKLFKVL